MSQHEPSESRSRLPVLLAGILTGLVLGALLSWWLTKHAAHSIDAGAHAKGHAHGHAHDGPGDKDIARVKALHEGRTIEVDKPCRQGAFVESSQLINSVALVSKGLPANTPDRTRAELDSMLYTLLKQAKSEVHCVSGALSHGYDKSYAKSIQQGVNLARERQLPADIPLIGERVIQTLHANQKITP